MPKIVIEIHHHRKTIKEKEVSCLQDLLNFLSESQLISYEKELDNPKTVVKRKIGILGKKGESLTDHLGSSTNF